MASISNLGTFCIIKGLWLLFHLAGTSDVKDLEYKDITIIVISQSNSYHAKRAELFKEHITEQVERLGLKEKQSPKLFLLHEVEDLPEIGAWTLFPVFSHMGKIFPKTKWTFVCEEDTRVRLPKLLEALQQHDVKQELFLARGLHDSAVSIIHHYWPFEDPSSFSYPDLRAGFVLSLPVVEGLAAGLEDLRTAKIQQFDFSIDSKHDFARYLHDAQNVTVTQMDDLCVKDEGEKCATYNVLTFPECGKPVPDSEIRVAVKTCEKFHKDRVPIVKKTWEKETSSIEYFSDVEDPSIPTISLGIPNTERGHCGKTLALMKRAVKQDEGKKWLLIADDDTIISLTKLRKLLACYDPSEPVGLGERYGYLAAKTQGYDYITGGGGMVFSWPLVKMLAEDCVCPANDSPDDMILGMCFRRFYLPVTHTPFLHQARVEDYSPEFLKHRSHVSFHKHYMSDPVKTYKFLQEDLKEVVHDEL